MKLVSPLNEAAMRKAEPAPRLRSGLRGRRVALLDISKPGGSHFLDRLECLLKERHGVGVVGRFQKPTFTKPAPESLIAELAAFDAVIEGLAD
jgi:hypothetical protein